MLPARPRPRAIVPNRWPTRVAARTAEQVFATLGELKGGAAKLARRCRCSRRRCRKGRAPYRSALRRLTDGPGHACRSRPPGGRADLTAVYGPGWPDRLVTFHDIPAAAASIGQVHRGQWRTDGGQVVEVARRCSIQIGPGAAPAPPPGPAAGEGDGQPPGSTCPDQRTARRAHRRQLNYGVGRVRRRSRPRSRTPCRPEPAAAQVAGAHEPPGRTSVTVPAVRRHPRVLITRWLTGRP